MTVNTFDTLGVITAKGQTGKVKIVVIAGHEGNLKTDTCLVHITNPVTEVSFPEVKKDTVVMHMRHKMLLRAMVKPANADNTDLAWSVEGGSVSAMIIRDGKIKAAGCILPVVQSLKLSKEMGLRHRSGVGMSKETDAIVIIVSEEQEIISVAHKQRDRKSVV